MIIHNFWRKCGRGQKLILPVQKWSKFKSVRDGSHLRSDFLIVDVRT